MHHHTNDCASNGERFHHSGFGRRGGFRGPWGMGPHGWGGPGHRMRRGDVRTAILRLLAEEPMHGYQIIQELSERSGGAWSPSAGSIYPTLQLLADEGLVSAEEAGGKKIFSLTEAGQTMVADMADQPAPWDEATETGSGMSGYREAATRLAQPVMQIGSQGTPEQVAAAIEILNDARKKLYALLAED